MIGLPQQQNQQMSTGFQAPMPPNLQQPQQQAHQPMMNGFQPQQPVQSSQPPIPTSLPQVSGNISQMSSNYQPASPMPPSFQQLPQQAQQMQQSSGGYQPTVPPNFQQAQQQVLPDGHSSMSNGIQHQQQQSTQGRFQALASQVPASYQPLVPLNQNFQQPQQHQNFPPSMSNGVHESSAVQGQFQPPIQGGVPPMQGNMMRTPGSATSMAGNMSQIPGSMPQIPGSMPQMPGNMPPMSGNMPPMSGNMPTMSGNMPPMSGNMPSMPGNMPPMPGNMPSMPGNMPSMPGNMPSMPGNMPPMPPGFQQQQVQQQGFAQQKQRLDPNMMPSVVQVVEDDRSSRSGLFPTGYPSAELPPLVSTEFVAQDQGNSNPKFMRSSLYAIPQTQDMVKNSCLPLSLAITPFAALNSSEIAPPVIDLGDLGPVRCQRCKAYMCPFMEFIDGGRKFRCPFCRSSTPVEEAYFAHLDHTGRRTDIVHRPELYLGSYEFVATKQYCKNGVKPKEPAFIFMVDVSYNAVRNGIVELLCRNLVDILKSLPKDYGMDKSAVKIGLATYDNVIHFYNLSQEGRPEMLVVNDVSDMFVPFAEGFLVDFEQAEFSLVNCLKEIVNNFADTRITETMLGPVIQAGLDALKNLDRAGKLFVFHTSLPTLEAPGQLKNREDRKLLGSDKEKTVLTPGTEFYSKLGEDCVAYGCAVDLFLFPNSFIDVASLAPVCNLTGGSIYKYQYFDCARDGVRFLGDLKHDIERAIAFDVMIRLRTSTGSSNKENTTDIEMSAIDSDKAVQVEIKYDDKLDEKEPVIFQTAILFTSCSGQRRLRVHNMSLPVTQDFNQIYRLTDEDSIITHLFKAAERTVRDKSPKDMRDEIVNTCAHILSTYREKCSETAPLGQLILPECLKLLPVHVNCVMKNDALNGGSELTVDDRAWMMNLVPSMTVQEVSAFLYPRVYAISGLSLDSNRSFLQMPTQVRSSIEYFSSEEAYLIENSFIAFIWLGINVPSEWLHNVFGVSSLAHLDAEKHDLPERDNAYSRAVRQLVNVVDEGRSRHLKIFIIKQSEGLESWMKKFLVEDRYATNSISYVEFLCQVHREIRSLLS